MHAQRSTRVILSLLSLLVVIGAVVFNVNWQRQVSQASAATGHCKGQEDNGRSSYCLTNRHHAD